MNSPLFPFTTVLLVALLALTPLSFADDNNASDAKPEADFKSPEEGDKEDSPVTARGRSRNIPDGFVLMIFQVIPDNDFLFPAAPPFDPNRTFSETIHYRENEQGPRSLELYMLPEADAALLNKWREAYLAHYIAKEKGEDDARRNPPTTPHGCIKPKDLPPSVSSSTTDPSSLSLLPKTQKFCNF